ncbi:MAG: hypothetical protein IPJ76_05900 [Flavobacteriales bacterium]|nr:MAG: hypothetical protein IPJ76_05900 [Flavobacteriales bacterium]
MRSIALLLVALLSIALLWINFAIHRTPAVGSTAEVEALQAQLTYLEPRMHAGLPNDMQKLFPEGRVFAQALYALSWCGLAERRAADDTLRLHALREARWAYDELNSAHSQRQFPISTPLPLGAFYAGWRNQVLAALVALDPSDTAVAVAFDRESATIAAAFAGSASPYPESYTGQAWPADGVVALHSLRLHERLRGADHSAVIDRWVQLVRTRRDGRNMIPHKWSLVRDEFHQSGRGSSLALMNVFLPDIDSTLAAEQFDRWKSLFVMERFGVPAAREHPIGDASPGDIDSGPLILGFGPASTIVGAPACKRNGDVFHATECTRTVHGFGLATCFNGQRYIFGALPIADLFIAWGRSIPSAALESPPPGYGRFHALSLLLAALLWSPWLLRWWRRRRTSG